MFGLEEFLRDRLGMARAPQQAQPKRSVRGAQPSQTPAQRDFPGRTNYGVPEDNMIDTPSGYVKPEQYNAMKRFRVQPDSPEQQLRYRLQMPQRPQFKRFEDGSMIMGDTTLPAYDSVDDFTTPRY